jgi:tetratricopeptide (TPR) repeat protein
MIFNHYLPRQMAAVLIFCFSTIVSAEPFVPKSESEVLEHLPKLEDYSTRELRHLRNRLAEDPNNLKLAVSLAARYLDIGRAEGDPRYSGYAQAALAPWLNQLNPSSQVLLYRALIRQRSHRFDDALEDLARVLQLQPRNARVWLTQAVILEVRGDYAGALDSCLMVSRLSHSLTGTTCMANVASLSGQAQKSYRVLSQALHDGYSVNPTERLWALTVLAEIAVRLGQDHGAERHFREALDLGIRDVYLLGAFADFLLDQARYEEARDLLDGDTRADALLLRLALTEQPLNSTSKQERMQQIRARFAAERTRGEELHLREEARFTLHLLNQPVQALRIALKNWDLQREPADSRVVLEAALAAGDFEAATPVLKWLDETGIEDVRLTTLSRQFGITKVK